MIYNPNLLLFLFSNLRVFLSDMNIKNRHESDATWTPLYFPVPWDMDPSVNS
jgi:hypothetical protein